MAFFSNTQNITLSWASHSSYIRQLEMGKYLIIVLVFIALALGEEEEAPINKRYGLCNFQS